jgi:hypothetical protein
VRGFRQFFGFSDSCALVYSNLSSERALVRLPISAKQSTEAVIIGFAKPGVSGIRISAQAVASTCELRATAYVAGAFTKNRIAPQIIADEAIREKLDIDFVSFGAVANLKSMDVFQNKANSFGHFDIAKGCFVFRSSGRPVHLPQSDFDHGLIIRVHPEEFPTRSWFACAGFGEWGTSGTAWFLANKWNHLKRKLERATDDFMAVIQIRPGQDESARMVALHDSGSGEVSRTL